MKETGWMDRREAVLFCFFYERQNYSFVCSRGGMICSR